MSFSIWLALSLKPMGMPPVTSRTRSANFLKSAAVCKCANVGGDTAGSPSGIPRTCEILPTFLLPGRWPPVPAFCALPTFEVESLNIFQFCFVIPELRTRQFVIIAGVSGLFLWQHSAFSRANACPCHFGAFRQSQLGFFRQGSETHVGNKQGNLELQRLSGSGPDNQFGVNGDIFKQRLCSHLRRHHLNIIPVRQQMTGHPHGGHRTMVPHL